MARIKCGHCGGVHATADEVRTCAGTPPDTEGVETESFDWDGQDSEPAPPPAFAPSRSATRAAAFTPPTPASPPPDIRLDEPGRPGPDALGRGAVVNPGQAAPAPWASAERVVIDRAVLADPAATVARLARAWHDRRRVVIELAVPFEDPPASVTTGPVWER